MNIISNPVVSKLGFITELPEESLNEFHIVEKASEMAILGLKVKKMYKMSLESLSFQKIRKL